MRIILTSVLLLVFLILSCKKKETISANKNQTTFNSQVISLDDIKALGVKEEPLDKMVKDSVFTHWKSYQEILTQTTYVRQADLAFFESDLKGISELIKPFTDSIPNCFNTKGIASRSKAVASYIYKMHSTLKLKSLSKTERLGVVKSYLESVSNLNYQLNKKFEYDQYNVGLSD